MRRQTFSRRPSVWVGGGCVWSSNDSSSVPGLSESFGLGLDLGWGVYVDLKSLYYDHQ